ncbi:retrovirus-related pol polyprotein from transposon TNT 1-94 [Tanacetum coccineum]
MLKKKQLFNEKEEIRDQRLQTQDETLKIKHETDLYKKAFKERENKYLEDIVSLEEKLRSHDRIVYKMSHSLQTIHMLGKKPNKVYDPHLKTGLGYENLKRLKKAIEAQPKMYDGENLKSNKLKVDLPDYEETLEDAKKIVSIEQTYFSSPFTSNVSPESSSKKSDLPPKKMPNESQLLKLFVNLDNEIKELGKLINIHHKMDEDISFIYDNKAGIRCLFTIEVVLISRTLNECSKDIKQELIAEHTKSKSTSKDVKKSHSSVSLVSNKRDTLNSNDSKSNANVLKAKTVNVLHDGSNLVCVSWGKDVFMIYHDKFVARYALSLNSRVKRALFTSSVAAKSSKLGATPVVTKSSGCSKRMTGNLKLLRNFVEIIMGTVCFRNDHFAAITGYGDYIHGNLTICHVYYVEGLKHNLFSVGQFCDGDLEVAFRSNTCYIWNLKGENLLTGSRDSILYTISISKMADSSLVCLMSKATSIKSWLWHRRLSHLNFGTINHLTKQDLVDWLSRFKYDKNHLCSGCEQGKSKKAIFPPKLVPTTDS